MGLVRRALVQRTDSGFTVGLFDPMDDENTLTLMEVMIDDE